MLRLSTRRRAVTESAPGSIEIVLPWRRSLLLFYLREPARLYLLQYIVTRQHSAFVGQKMRFPSARLLLVNCNQEKRGELRYCMHCHLKSPASRVANVADRSLTASPFSSSPPPPILPLPLHSTHLQRHDSSSYIHITSR